jgi:WD40 repeat protein
MTTYHTICNKCSAARPTALALVQQWNEVTEYCEAVAMAARSCSAASSSIFHSASSAGSSLSVLQFLSDVNELTVASSFEMDGPTRCVACCPTQSSLVLTAPEQGPAANYWKIPYLAAPSMGHDDEDNDNYDSNYGERSFQNTRSMIDNYVGDNDDKPQVVATLLPESGFGANIVDMAWRNTPLSDDSNGVDMNGDGNGGDLLTLDTNGHLTRWDIECSSATAVTFVDAPTQVHSEDTNIHSNSNVSMMIPSPKVVWDPHHAQAVAVTTHRSVSILDWRSSDSSCMSEPTGTATLIANNAATRWGISYLDYNPNKSYILATSSLNGSIHIWDLRQTKQPVMTARGGHSHWASTVSYNPSHDQLVLSTGTDCVANLWRLSTCSSASLLQDTATTMNPGAAATNASAEGAISGDGGDGAWSETAALTVNVRVARQNQHNDSIYAASWGAADSWIYLTISFDGKARLHHVPSKEKYKILL